MNSARGAEKKKKKKKKKGKRMGRDASKRSLKMPFQTAL